MHAVLLISDANRDGLDALGATSPDLIVLDARDLTLRELVQQAGMQVPDVSVFVRIEPLAGAGPEQLAAALAAAPQGIWLSAALGRAQVEELASRLAVAEAESDMPDGSLRIVASVETAAGALAAPSLAEVGPRLAAISLDLASLSRELGCEAGSGPHLPDPLRAARGSVALSAAAAGIPAICSATAEPADLDAFAAEASRARRDGFSAMLARDLRQVEVLRRLPGQAPFGRWMENFVSGVATK
jgi:citrate lyase subunit beta/citryl-CoA lyase